MYKRGRVVFMSNTQKYLSLLAEVMKTKDSNGEKKKKNYDSLFCIINTTMKEQLLKSMYPFTSDIIQRTDDMLEAMESLYLVPEVVSQRCLLISNYCTTSVFFECGDMFEDKQYAGQLRKIYTQIPLVVSHGEENSIEVLNYANLRINLTMSEFKFLVAESVKRKIALNKIIQVFIVKTRIVEKDLCIISDNIYGTASNLLDRAIDRRLAYVDKKGLEKIKKRNLTGFDGIVVEKSLIPDMDDSLKRRNIIILIDELDSYTQDNLKTVLYGFKDEFKAIEAQILEYYETQAKQISQIRQDVVGDIVRLEDSGDRTLEAIRSLEDVKERKINSEKKTLKEVLKNVEDNVSKVAEELNESNILGKRVPRHIFDDVFDLLFHSNAQTSLLNNVLSRLYSLEYDNYDLVLQYVQYLSGAQVHIEPIPIEKHEWEKAKMIIEMIDLDKTSVGQLKLYVGALGTHCSTGKEYYAEALVARDAQKSTLLQCSFDRGYIPAGKALLERYKRGDRNVNILTLANALVPEACMHVADRKMSSHKNRRHFVDLADDEFTYYKIAAARQYEPAIGKIIQVV